MTAVRGAGYTSNNRQPFDPLNMANTSRGPAPPLTTGKEDTYVYLQTQISSVYFHSKMRKNSFSLEIQPRRENKGCRTENNGIDREFGDGRERK